MVMKAIRMSKSNGITKRAAHSERQSVTTVFQGGLRLDQNAYTRDFF